MLHHMWNLCLPSYCLVDFHHVSLCYQIYLYSILYSEKEELRERRNIRGQAACCELPEGRPCGGDGGPELLDPRAEWNSRLPQHPVGGDGHQEPTLGGQKQVSRCLPTLFSIFPYSIACLTFEPMFFPLYQHFPIQSTEREVG